MDEKDLGKGPPILFEYGDLDTLSMVEIDNSKADLYKKRARVARISLRDKEIPIRCPVCSLSVKWDSFNRDGIRLECSHRISHITYNSLIGTRTIREIANEIARIWFRESNDDGRRKFNKFKLYLHRLSQIQTISDSYEFQTGKEIVEEFIARVLTSPDGKNGITWWGWSHPRAEAFKHELITKISEIHVDYRWNRNAIKRYWKNQAEGKGVYK